MKTVDIAGGAPAAPGDMGRRGAGALQVVSGPGSVGAGDRGRRREARARSRVLGTDRPAAGSAGDGRGRPPKPFSSDPPIFFEGASPAHGSGKVMRRHPYDPPVLQGWPSLVKGARLRSWSRRSS